MDYKRNLLLFTNQIEEKIIYNEKEWKIKFEINFDFFILSLYYFDCIYQKTFYFEDLIYNELFNKEKNIKDIIIKIMELIKEKKYEIIENNENIFLIIDKQLNFNILKKKKTKVVKKSKLRIDKLDEIINKEENKKEFLNYKKQEEEKKNENKVEDKNNKNTHEKINIQEQNINYNFDKIYKNEIECEYDIKKRDNIQILNCYEEVKSNNSYWQKKLIIKKIKKIMNYI